MATQIQGGEHVYIFTSTGEDKVYYRLKAALSKNFSWLL